MALSVAQVGARSVCGSCACSPKKQITPPSAKLAPPCTPSFRKLPALKAGANIQKLVLGRQLAAGERLGSSAEAFRTFNSSLSKRSNPGQVRPRAENPGWSQGTTTDKQGSLSLVDVRLTLAPVEDLIPVARRLPAPKDTGVYALVPTTLFQRDGPEGDTSSIQRMSREDAMGFALGAATGNRSGPIDGPGWTLLDPAAALGSRSFPSAGPLLSSSPRRTLRVEFTCNKCWERTIRAINPQAYKTGTVFVQCKGCNVYHKLVDNLNLFHELQGPIYSPPGQLLHTPYDPFKSGMPGGFDGLPFQ